jgi:hypothetical protein
MASSGSTRKITVNQLLGAGGTATLASATITGDLTVDTNVLKVDTTNNRVGIGTATPSTALNVVAGSSGINTTFDTPSAGDTRIELKNNGTRAGYVYWDTSEVRQFADSGRALTFYPNATLGMTLNSTGLGVGVASPAFKLDVQSATGTVIRIKGGSGANQGGALYVTAAGSTSTFFAVGDRANIFGGTPDTTASIYTISGVPLTFDVGGTTQATLNSTGLGVGTVAANGIKLATYVTTAGGPATSGTAQSAGSFRVGAASTAGAMDMGTAGSYSWIQATNASNLATNYNVVINPNGGELLVGTTNASVGVAAGFRTGDSGGRLEIGSANSTNSSIGFDMYSTGAAAYRFYVGWGGTVYATNTTISAISDARLKENVQDLDVGLDAILALKPRKFDWKAGKGKDIKGDRGFIAQEFEQVFPQLVDEWKDNAPEGEAPYKSVRQDLIPVLVKAIQELTARVQTLEAR